MKRTFSEIFHPKLSYRWRLRSLFKMNLGEARYRRDILTLGALVNLPTAAKVFGLIRWGSDTEPSLWRGSRGANKCW